MPRSAASALGFRLFVTAFVVSLSVLPAGAQLRRIPIEIVTLTESASVRAGSTVKAALQVTLPEGLHVQSNKPRDPALIPTELLLEPPTGVTGVEVVFPKAVDFPQEGLPEPLLVFDREFTIGVQLSFAGTLPAGPLTVPFELRYQACDDKVCFAPSSKKGEWTVELVPATAAVTAQHQDVLGAIAFGTGEKPAVAAPAFYLDRQITGQRRGLWVAAPGPRGNRRFRSSLLRLHARLLR